MSRVPSFDARGARWLSRRARNVARRQLRLAVLSGCGFILALIAVIVVPRGAQRVARSRQAPIPPRRDTASIVLLIDRAETRLSGASAALAAARAETASARIPQYPEQLSLANRARHDSLAYLLAALGTALERARSAPLAASYRSLARAQAMRSDSAVSALLDSLTVVERARDQFDALGVVDPVYISLTNRVGSIGDDLTSIAEQKSAEIQSDLARLAPPHTAQSRESIATDTIPFITALDSAARELARAHMMLSAARAHNAEVLRLEGDRRRGAAGSVPPVVILLAAAVLGTALGFLLSLIAEIRNPAVADAREAEVLTGAPLLSHLAALQQVANRGRRRADRDVPRLIELSTDRYARLFFQLADEMSRLSSVAVLGESPAVVATVAANLAAAAAHNARATLLLDADVGSQSISGALRVRAAPGITDVLANRVEWATTLIPVLVGRDRMIDVIPAGAISADSSISSAAPAFREEIEHFGRRYDTLIVSAPASRPGLIAAVGAAVPHSIVVARFGKTRISELRRLLGEAREAGTAIRGVVVWDREDPELLAPPDEDNTSPARQTEDASVA